MPPGNQVSPGTQELLKPLSGLRVIGVEQYIAGPYCSMLLADAGAEVIKIERPVGGDPRRQIGPLVQEHNQVISGGFYEYNRNKKSLTLNLRQPEGREIFKTLISTADVLIVNLKPGSMDKLGLGYEDLKSINPGLIYSSITGFGEMPGFRGPFWDQPAFDIVAEAMSGIMHNVGYADGPPLFTIFGMADLYTALVNAYAIMLALVQRQATGQGQQVDTAMYDSMLSLNERSAMIHSFTGEIPGRGRERVQGPRGAFKAKDGYLAFTTPTDEMWGRFAKAIHREDLISHPLCVNGPGRAANCEGYLRPVIEQWLSDKTVSEAIKILKGAGIPAGPVQTMADIFACPQVKSRKMLLEIPTPAGPKKMLRSPVLMGSLTPQELASPPGLGEHNIEILRSLGYSREQIELFKQAGVI